MINVNISSTWFFYALCQLQGKKGVTTRHLYTQLDPLVVKLVTILWSPMQDFLPKYGDNSEHHSSLKVIKSSWCKELTSQCCYIYCTNKILVPFRSVIHRGTLTMLLEKKNLSYFFHSLEAFKASWQFFVLYQSSR